MNTSHDEDLSEASPSSGRPSPWPESVILLIIGALLSLDLASDAEMARSKLHVTLELVAACLAIVALGWIWARWLRICRELEGRIDDLARRPRAPGGRR